MSKSTISLVKLAALAALSLLSSAHGAVVAAAFSSATTVPVTAASYNASGNSVDLSLNFAPPTGTTLTVVKNTGLAFIAGQFSNLPHGQVVTLTFNGTNYKFVANYFGGTGNDLVLQWASVKIYGWGVGGYGQLGTGNTLTGWTPTAAVATGVLAGKTPTGTAMGTNHSLAVCADGTAVSCGKSDYGQMGNGSTFGATLPTLVTTSGVLSGKTVIAVTAAQAQSFFLCSDGMIASCGSVNYGLLGNSSTNDSLVPGAVTAMGGLAGKSVVAIRAGGFHCLALCSDGTIASWGGNDNAQLGNGTTNYDGNTVPVSVVTTGALAGKTVVSIAAGNRHNLALCSDGTLVSWGYNISGQLGNNSTSNSTVPVAITNSGALSGKTVTAIAASYNSSFALCSDGTIAGWGDNAYGQLGSKSVANPKIPFALPSRGVLTGKTVTALSAGEGHCVAVCSDGTLAVWGGNTYYQLGTGNRTDSIVPVAVATTGIGAGEKFLSLAAGPFQNFSLAIAAVPLPSNNANLAGLTISSASLSPAFAASTTAYTASVGNAITTMTVTPTVADSTAAVKVNGTAVTSGTASGAQPLTIGANVIAVVVTAQDFTTKTYTLTVTRAGSAVSSLAGLGLSTGTLSPAFASGTTAYQARLLHATNSLTVTPTVTEPNASVTVNGTPVVSGTASQPITRSAGSQSIVVKVTAQDGVTTSTYSVALRDDTTLTGLGVSAGATDPAFSPGIVDYVVQVSNTISAIAFTPTAADPSATIRVNGTAVASGASSAPLNLTLGDNPAVVMVTALDGSTTAYNIIVARLGIVDHVFTSAASVPFTAPSYSATGKTITLALGFSPPPGTSLTVVNNTGLAFIQGTFDNLSHGQRVTLRYGGVAYPFVANYYGGTGNDLVLQWANARLMTWGYNNHGQLGVNRTIDSSFGPAPVDMTGVLSGKTVLTVAAGDNHCLALCADGTLAAWGNNSFGQLGINTLGQSAVLAPVLVVRTGVLAGKTVIAIAAGNGHSLALCSDGTLAAWGVNSYGQLGNNTTTASSVPLLVDRSGVLASKAVVAISAGNSHSLAICADGSMASWGAGASGQLGNGTTTPSKVPVLPITTGVLAGKSLLTAVAGDYHELALATDGTLAAWGYNSDGTLGNNSTTSSSVPVQVQQTGVLAGKTVTAIAAGYGQSIALCADGTLAAWGGPRGLLGNNSTTSRSVPVLVDRTGALAGKTAVAVAAGPSSSLALCADGTLTAWGSNGHGELGINSTVADSFVPVAVSTTTLGQGERPIAVVAGGNHVLAVTGAPVMALVTSLAATGITDTGAVLNGSVNAQGSGTTVVFEYGPTTAYGFTAAATPATVTGTATTAVSAGLGGLLSGTTYHYRVVGTAGGGTARGSDLTFTTTTFASLANLTLGTGTLMPGFSRIRTSYAVTLPATTTDLTVVPGVADAGATVTVNGVAVASGAASAPVSLAVGNNPISIVVTAAGGGNSQTYAVTATRLPEVFTFNSAAEVPVTVGDFLATGNAAAFALNFTPPYGTNLTVVRNTGFSPIQGTFANLAQGQPVNLTVGGFTYRFVANYFGGTGNDLVLQWGSTRLLACGDNSSGQLGDNTVTGRTVPTPVDQSGVLAGKVVIGQAAGSLHSLALCADGTLAAWGNNGFGRLGNRSTTQSNVPVLVDRTGVLAGKTVVGVAAGDTHSLAWCADGTIATWGGGPYGQLGINSTGNQTAPVLVDRTGVLAGKTVVAVAVGGAHNLVLCTDGTLIAWGSNTGGQLGNGTTTSSSVPALVNRTGVLAGKTVVAIAAGGSHSLVLCADGRLAAWGYNYYGGLGNNGTNSVGETLPVLVATTGVLAGKTVVAISAGASHSLALCADGTVATWGYNYYGGLGNNSTTDSTVPVLVASTGVLAGKTVVGLSGGRFHNLARCSDGSLAAWGYNINGQLGNNSTTQTAVPVTVNTGNLRAGETIETGTTGNLANHDLFLVGAPPPPAVTMLVATGISGLGGTLNAGVSANAANTTVRFEYGLTPSYGSTSPATPATVTGTGVTPVTFALGGLSPGTTYHYRAIATNSNGTATGVDTTFTTLSDNAWLAGLGLDPGLLVPGFSRAQFSYMASVPFSAASVTVNATTEHPRASVKVNGAVGGPVNLSVGNNPLAITATAEDGVATKTYLITVTRLPQEFAFNSASDVPVSANGFTTGGYPATLTLTYAPVPGTILTMVNNTGLGFITGAFANLSQGQRVTLSYGGNSFDFAVNYFGGTGNDLVLQWADTKVAAWGSNSYGQLGDGTTLPRLQPTLIDASGVLADKTVVAVAEGYLHSLALCADGTLAAWGYNLFGQLGNGSAVPSSVPVAVDRTGALAGKTIVAIAAGPFHNLALCSDGTVVAWGNNNYGQLGDGTTVTRRVPVRVSPVGALAGKQVVAVAAAAYSSFALCDDGTVVAWGYNDEGELGIGTSITSLLPVMVSTSGALSGKRVTSLAAGQYHTLALCIDGTLVSWGYNNRGQLGNNSTTSSSQPVAIGSFGVLAGKTPVGISAGAYHSLVRCADGTVAAWGANNLGQLGAAGAAPSAVPVAVSLAAANQIAAGGSHSVALGADGTLFAWGDNADGQLGDNSTTSRAAPAAVDFSAVAAGTRVMAVASSSAARHNLALVALAAPTGKAGRQTNAATAAAIDDLLSVAFGSNAGQYPQPLRVGDDFVIRFTQPAGVIGLRYGAEWSATLLPGSWQDLPDTGVDGEHCFRLPAGGQPRGFMRLKVTRE